MPVPESTSLAHSGTPVGRTETMLGMHAVPEWMCHSAAEVEIWNGYMEELAWADWRKLENAIPMLLHSVLEQHDCVRSESRASGWTAALAACTNSHFARNPI